MASTKYHQKSLSTMQSEDLENRRINRKIKKQKRMTSRKFPI
ncbi:hypothetical protein OIU79_008913 [Salix purpurea]|uniref:Uncharacterized protein n=1 Tax=Salix purpurea TaxID=77065 RepID=A0A9Q0TJM3_SALPP|nr:hypothetical protein OIU79_008913 [Salix purpurea]